MRFVVFRLLQFRYCADLAGKSPSETILKRPLFVPLVLRNETPKILPNLDKMLSYRRETALQGAL